MTEIAIRVENLSKQYRIGAKQERFPTLRDWLADAFAAPFRRLSSTVRGQSSAVLDETIWALKDVSFEVKRGEVVGIIGRNGSGKTTLLKILSRITEPTEGCAEIHGRVGSLLEVGTGFHPELTGRENITLNGAILGMKRVEIEEKFDEIVAFAEVDKFIDTPVKHYSSGMYLRLAFAVAAHLEPEILLVDEVLAVGDAAFQRKCLGKMGDVAREGRTVLFVSHQMNQIRRLCGRVIWLDAGQIQKMGQTAKIVGAYESAMACVQWDSQERLDAPKTGARFLRWGIIEPRSRELNLLEGSEACSFRTIVQVNKPIRDGHHGIALWSDDGQLMWAWAANNIRMGVGLSELVYTLPSLPLRPGVYHWQTSLYESGALLDNWYCTPELIIATKPQTDSRDEWNGILNLTCDFEINLLE